MPLEDRPERIGDLAGGERTGRDLVGERLEEVEVPPIDERDLDRGLRSFSTAWSPPKPPPTTTTRCTLSSLIRHLNVAAGHWFAGSTWGHHVRTS